MTQPRRRDVTAISVDDDADDDDDDDNDNGIRVQAREHCTISLRARAPIHTRAFVELASHGHGADR